MDYGRRKEGRKKWSRSLPSGPVSAVVLPGEGAPCFPRQSSYCMDPRTAKPVDSLPELSRPAKEEGAPLAGA